MKHLVAILFLCVAVITSCKKDDDGFPYQGNWKGTYTGADNGTWNATVGNDGKFTGTATSAMAPNFPFAITGTVSNDGKLSATYGYLNYTATFKGQLTGESASGTWAVDSAGIAGTWTGTRQ